MSLPAPDIGGYGYSKPDPGHMHGILLKALEKALHEFAFPEGCHGRLFDLGCGNGSAADVLQRMGYEVTGIDPSPTGITVANQAFPAVKMEVGSAYEDLQSRFGTFPCVYSLEVIEHVYDPRLLVKNVYAMLDPGGYFVLSTPYHGYLKNLALAITGKMEAHFTALWDHGHIKFWSPASLTFLLEEAGFEVKQVSRLGRIPPLAMTMLVVAQKPQS
jgi:2-polyprenyl-3-methyl-5-hydroxy-6-metoxy-1,4-benzoquinol methylase